MAVSRAVLSLLAIMSAVSAEDLRVHLLSPWKNDPKRSVAPAILVLNGSGGPIPYRGTKMTPEGEDGWFVATLSGLSPADGYRNFDFASYVPSTNDPYADEAKYRVGGNPFIVGDVFFRHGSSEVWIYPQGDQLPIIADAPPGSKVVFLLSPWEAGLPEASSGGADWTLMRPTGAARCGWHAYWFRKADKRIRFRNSLGGQALGSKGLGDTANYDLGPYFAARDTAFLATDTAGAAGWTLLPAFPAGSSAACAWPLSFTLRDFSRNHPDFEEYTAPPIPATRVPGMVKNTLSTELRPEPVSPNPDPHASNLSGWFVTDSTNANPALRSYESCGEIPMTPDTAGYLAFDAARSATAGFFPADASNRFEETSKPCESPADHGNCVVPGPQTLPRNFHFCTAMEAEFKYEKGQSLEAAADDDLWIFLNGKLVLDQGGVHPSLRNRMLLDTVSGITAGNRIDLRIFHCERQTPASDFSLRTNFRIRQPSAYFAEPVPGAAAAWTLKERFAAGTACPGSAAASLSGSTFRMAGPSVPASANLPIGISYGGISVDASADRISIDMAKVTGLSPGPYTVTARSNRSGRTAEIRILVPGDPLATAFRMPAAGLRMAAHGNALEIELPGLSPARELDVSLADGRGRVLAAGRGLSGARLRLDLSRRGHGVYRLLIKEGGALIASSRVAWMAGGIR